MSPKKQNTQKESVKKKDTKNSKASSKVVEGLKEAQDFLTQENINFSSLKDEEVISLYTKTKQSPKFPFSIRVYGNEIQDAIALEDGKRYSVDQIKKIVTGSNAYFELQSAEFKYDPKHNSIYVIPASSKKG